MAQVMRKALPALVFVVIAVAGVVYFLRPSTAMTVSAEFARTDAVFAGNKVTVLGVPTGRIESVTPHGGQVRVVMSLPAGTKIPMKANAWVISPSVISDRTIEIDPGYVDGPTLADGAVIPPDRSHSPLTWDQLTTSVNNLITAVGPSATDPGGGIGNLIHVTADALAGNGQAFHDAITNVTQASTLLAGKSGDVTALLSSLDTLVQTIADNRTTVDSLTNSITATTNEFSTQRAQLTQALSTLPDVLGQVSALIAAHGSALTSDVTQLAQLTGAIASKQAQLKEIIDVVPTGFQNVANVVTPDGRARVRLDVSTQLAQFPAAQALCAQLPIPMCQGSGMVNPVEPPPNVSEPDLGHVMRGGH